MLAAAALILALSCCALAYGLEFYLDGTDTFLD